MPFQTKLAKSSRVTKSRPKLQLHRSSSSPFSSAPRRKPSQSSHKGSRADEELDDVQRLGYLAPVPSLAGNSEADDVLGIIEHVSRHMFDDLPLRGSGMNSTRIAEVLNFRARLPPIVTNAHIIALSADQTRVARELAEMKKARIIRQMIIPGRRLTGHGLDEGVAIVEAWIQMVEAVSSLEGPLKAKYISFLKDKETERSVAGVHFSAEETASLVSCGFLTATSLLSSVSHGGISISGSLASLATAGSTAASGSLAAVGGQHALNAAAGGGSQNRNVSVKGRFQVSLPNTGPYLRLLGEARTELLELLSKISPKYKEAPLHLLRDRWNGGVAAPSAGPTAARFGSILPSKTKKWKQFWGLNFDWVLEECVGAGLVECFDTGSVGLGVRAFK